MRWIVLALVLFAGTAQALDVMRIAGNAQLFNVTNNLSASMVFTGPRVVKVFCSISCWVTASATNVDTKYVTSISSVVVSNETIYLAVPQSNYVLLRRYGSTSGDGVITPVEEANSR